MCGHLACQFLTHPTAGARWSIPDVRNAHSPPIVKAACVWPVGRLLFVESSRRIHTLSGAVSCRGELMSPYFSRTA